VLLRENGHKAPLHSLMEDEKQIRLDTCVYVYVCVCVCVCVCVTAKFARAGGAEMSSVLTAHTS